MKTPEEIKKGLSEPELFCSHCQYSGEPHGCNRPNGSCQAFDNADDALDYIQQLEAQVPKWISVKDRLPEQPHKWDARGWYLVALKNGVVKELCYEFLESSVFGYGWRETAYPVTHWMPLPEPPKEEEREAAEWKK